MKTKLKFTLINPTSPLWRIDQRSQKPKNSSVFRFSMLPSLSVAAAMPDYVETTIIDEDVEPIDFNTDSDLIGITFMTYNAPRAYEIADIFRAKGKTVIFGGYHPTFMKEEAIEHADAICIGEAEGNVSRMISDFLKGNLQPFYQCEPIDLADLKPIDRKLIKNGAYITLNAMQATRGCYNQCEFCSVAAFNQYKFRFRPVFRVIEEMRQLGNYILFMDDNITLNRAYALELFEAMKPLKKKWFSQCSITIAEDDELLDLAYESGCRGLFLGFESLSQKSISNWKKDCNKRSDYRKVVQKLHEKGIVIFGAFVFGEDHEGPEVFEQTLDFLLDENVDTLQATRLTPFPGTPLFKKMDQEGRIFDKNWSHYDFWHVVHQPMGMDVKTLHAGTAWVLKEFYSRKNIVRRISRAASYLELGILARTVIPINFGYRVKIGGYGTFEIGKRFQPKPEEMMFV